jgi:hypothetical protein
MMKREASPAMKRENPTPGKAFGVLSSDETRMTIPVARASLLDWNPLIFLEPSSRFIVGLAPNRWTFSRSMGGPTSGPGRGVPPGSPR